jgi:hypothetical protein
MSKVEVEHEKTCSDFCCNFECYCLDAQKYVLEQLVFTSIGFANSFLDLWTVEVIWKVDVYTLSILVGGLSWELGS